MTNVNNQTNGASLEDCHTNFFSLTDVCGIKWVVLRSGNQTGGTGEPLEDPVLLSFSKCLEDGLLAVWRRVPRRSLVNYSFDQAGNQVKQPTKGHDDKNQLSQCKELWLFWYGEKPDSIKTLVSEELKEISDCSGSWESGIPYEARTLLFKAVNNLIERSLLSKEFVRLGKWFVQPYDGQEKTLHKSSHLSFSFQYFVHGESAVCTSVDVRQHPPVRRLTHSHLASAATLSTSIHVVLAPYGMAGTLTGTSFQDGDPAVTRLLEEWKAFWPLYNNCYTCRDNSGEQVDMPAGVEVVVSGVRLVYPTSYVLVTDIDNHLLCEASGVDNVEPSPFTGSSHELISRGGEVASLGQSGAVDCVLPDTDYENSEREDMGGSSSSQLAQALANWEFVNTNKTFKRKNRRTVKREVRDFKGNKFKGGAPVFKKGELGDPIMWGLDQDGFSSAAARGRINQGHSTHHTQPNNRVPSEGLPMQSPASVGPVTPGPLSVKSETAMPLLSPHTNGPTTPVYTPGDSVPTFNPATPSTPGGPKSQGPPSSVPSPFRAVNPALADRKPDMSSLSNVLVSPTTSKTSVKGSMHAKRPALPAKEYEEISDSLSLTSAYDYSAMTAWLSHPVKKSRPCEGTKLSPKRPMYRRKSQSELFASIDLDHKATVAVKPAAEVVKNVSQVLTNGVSDVANLKPKTEFDENKPVEEENLFSADGLKPSMTDLDNMFEDSDSEGGLGCVPTPPNSVKPQIHEDEFTKIPKKDPPGNLPNDQLHQMFPTPPSHEHPNLHSPGGDQDMHQDSVSMLHPNMAVKTEPASPRPDHYFPSHSVGHTESVPMSVDNDDYFDHTMMLASSKFAPLPASALPSNQLPPLPVTDVFRFKPNFKPVTSHPTTHTTVNPMSASSSQLKPGLSPISPATSDANPRSNKSTNPPSVGGPRSVGPTTPRVPHTPIGAGSGGGDNSPPPPLANSLTINLVLSDSLLNLYRDINFNSCTMCVCTNEGNIKGGESLMYLPEFAGDDDHDCKCGYSAVVNRKFTHLAGMFLEDEREVTGIQEDLYFKKKLSLLLLDPKSQEQGEHRFNERASVVDAVSCQLMEVIQQQAGLFSSEHSSIINYSNHYLRNTTRQQHIINIVEDMDGTDTIWAALETVRASSTEGGKSDLDMSSKSGCLHKWPIIPAPGPFCSEDIVRVMKCLSPVLNISLHVRKGTKSTELVVDGPLTWRQFHRMAGVTTKGNTDDGCEPLPIPSVMVGYERECMSVSPFSLYYWDSLSMEPWAPPRDVAYIVVAPDNDNLLHEVKTFFKVLSNGYESLKLGRHTPITKALRDGILKVGAKRAGKLENEAEHDEWFSAIGDGENSELLRLYSKVCHHYLVPLLTQIPLEAASLLKRDSSHSSMGPPDLVTGDKAGEDAGESNKDSSDPLQGDDPVIEPPAIVIYMIDPFSFGVDNPELMRLSSMALMRCFNNMVQDTRLPSDSLRQSIYLQTISMESVYAVSREAQKGLCLQPPLNTKGNMSRANHLLRGLCMSVYTQSQRPLTFNTSTKTLTGFGPASAAERYLKGIETKDQFMRHMYCPPYILAPPSQKNKKTGDADGFGSSTERSTVLFVHYCLSDDQKHLLASLADDRGEMVRTTIININIPNRTRRKKASARRVGLKRLLDWILSVMALSLVPWRLVIGRLGRIGHGELRGWSTLLTRKSLKKAVKQLKDQCSWKSDMPTILSVCLISMEPDSVLRVMHDQYTPDERFGMTANQCNLSTPKDATATHILVFPTSATAQSAVQAAFNDHQTGDNGENDFGFGIDMNDLDVNPNDNEELGLGDLNDIFDADPFSSAGGGNSPSGSPRGNQLSQPGSPSNQIPGSDPAFRYGQEEPGERLEILQQPLALGYLTSTAQTGPMPRWFWASAPHLENVCPVFLKSALHINIANLAHGGEDGLVPQSASGRVHSLDSNYTTDVLRYVLEGYNALSWLVLDPQTHDRKSCLPIHVQTLLQLYHALAALV